MEVSLIGSSQAKLGKSELACRELGFCILKDNCRFSKNRVCFGRNLRWKKAGLALRAIHTEPVREDKKQLSGSGTRSKPVRLFFIF